MRVTGSHHAAIGVVDLERAERFYAGVLGLSVRTRWSHPDGTPRSIWVELGDGTFLAIEHALEIAPPATAGLICLALRITSGDRERWMAHLAVHGVAIERTSPYSIYFRDPEGALLALSHHPDAL